MMILDKDGKVFPLEFTDKPGYLSQTFIDEMNKVAQARYTAQTIVKHAQVSPLMKLLLENAQADKVHAIAEEVHGSPIPRQRYVGDRITFRHTVDIK
jgi:hypothetical protein